MEPVVVADADSLWLIAGGIALFLGVVALGININIRKTREASQQQAEKLQKEVQRLKSAQVAPKQQARDLRREALEEALRREPDLATQQDSESTKRLQSLVAEITEELRIRGEVEELKARQEVERQRALAAEETKRKIEEGARQAEALRRAEAERQAQAERDREARIAGMSQPRRFFARHPGVARVALVGAVLVAAGSAWGVAQVVADNRERAAAEAQAAEKERAAAEARTAAEAAAVKEQQRLAQLPTACDLTTPKADITNDIWLAWLTCADESVVAEAAVRANLRDLSGSELAGMAQTTKVSALAERISILRNTPERAHRILVDRWGPEVVGESYKIVYKQECTTGVRPENYVGGTTWTTDSGGLVEFVIKDCRVRGYPDTTIRGSYISTKYSNTRWSQVPEELRILSGYNDYSGNGSEVYRLTSDAIDAPKTLTRTE